MNTFVRFTLSLIVLALVAQPAVASAADAESLSPSAGTSEQEEWSAGPFGLPVPAVDGLKGAVQRSSCTATADCGANPSVSCSGNSSCSSVDRNCPGVGGAVTCDGVVTACSTNPSCAQGCAADWSACVAQCPPGVLNPCRIACAEERAACHCNC